MTKKTKTKEQANKANLVSTDDDAVWSSGEEGVDIRCAQCCVRGAVKRHIAGGGEVPVVAAGISHETVPDFAHSNKIAQYTAAEEEGRKTVAAEERRETAAEDR